MPPRSKKKRAKKGVPNASKPLPDNSTLYPSSSPVRNTHGPSSSSAMQTRSGDPNITDPISESHNSSSPAEPCANLATSTGTNILSGARDFAMYHPVFNVQGDSITVIQGMAKLSERVIEGAEYDSSLRDPPPLCHPGTRVRLLEKILKWFRDARRERALLWLSGPAGVGKSAVIQTVAESLAESDSVGATLFFSRPNERNDPQRVIVTIAFQLATRIPAYQNYITERIALNPSLLKKGMKEQFRIFITEPFGINGIGEGEGPWAILLDGLDECEGVDEQSRIVRLVSEFILNFSNTPLIWAIASRPEPHITATFDDEEVTPSYWAEYVPVDSTEACQDVEHYLNESFKAMRKQFRHLPSNWPSESQFLKLCNGARGLFVFASTAVRYMGDHNHADPVSRLNLIISIIDRHDIKVIDSHPFALLDALYAQILTSIPSSVWCTTKRLLGFLICTRRTIYTPRYVEDVPSYDGVTYILHSNSCSLIGASIILSLELSVAYSSLHKLHSVLDIPDSKIAHESSVTFLHASFGDYLTDRSRSKDFYIDREEVVDDISRGLFQLYLDQPWITKWKRYTPQLSIIIGPTFDSHLRHDARCSLEYALTGKLQSMRGRGPFKSQKDRSDCLGALSQINLAKVYELDLYGAIIAFLTELWNTFREELESTGRFKEVSLRDLKVDHLDYETNKPIFAPKDRIPIQGTWYHFNAINSQLQKYPISHPNRQAIIYGSLPENSVAFFAGSYKDKEGYYCFLYPY